MLFRSPLCSRTPTHWPPWPPATPPHPPSAAHKLRHRPPRLPQRKPFPCPIPPPGPRRPTDLSPPAFPRLLHGLLPRQWLTHQARPRWNPAANHDPEGTPPTSSGSVDHASTTKRPPATPKILDPGPPRRGARPHLPTTILLRSFSAGSTTSAPVQSGGRVRATRCVRRRISTAPCSAGGEHVQSGGRVRAAR